MTDKHYVIIHILPDGNATKTVSTRKPTLEELQHSVGGSVELVLDFKECPFGETRYRNGECWVNEDGRPRGLPINERATVMWHGQLLRTDRPLRPLTWLRGTVVYVARAYVARDE